MPFERKKRSKNTFAHIHTVISTTMCHSVSPLPGPVMNVTVSSICGIQSNRPICEWGIDANCVRVCIDVYAIRLHAKKKSGLLSNRFRYNDFNVFLEKFQLEQLVVDSDSSRERFDSRKHSSASNKSVRNRQDS